MRKLEDIRKVAVLGSGMMGTGCAMVFAGAGYDVVLYDVVPEALPKVLPNMRKDLTFLAERGLGRLEDVEPALDRVSTTLVMEDAVSDADFVLEAVIEDMTLKQQIFHDLDQMCAPEAVLATNTSVMSPTEIASRAECRERIIGTHWWNPPFLIPLVEVVQTAETAPWVIDLTMDLHRAIGKHPVHVKKDVPGFLATRLQHALWREAISIVENGIADAATVDESLKYGPGLRLPILAPLENADLVGLDLTEAIHDYVLGDLEDRHDASPLVKQKVAAGELGFKSGGVGLQTWTPEQQVKLRTDLLDYLCKAVRELNERESS